jgi:adenylate cyclase
MGGDARMSMEQLRSVLTGESPGFVRGRRVLQRLPSDPRCKLCSAPFAGVGGLLVRPFGFGKFPGNPGMCNKCIIELRKNGVSGVEIPVSLLFSDVRGSTALGEQLSPTEFREFLDHFYRLAARAITRHDGMVDKFVGDEVIGLFIGGLAGRDHPAKAVAAGLELAAAAASPNASPVGPLHVGTAVHHGNAFVGTTGQEGLVDDFTALGDVVNTTARLAAQAAEGEVLVSCAAAEAAGVDPAGTERRQLPLRGRSMPIEVLVLRPEPATA